MNLKKETITYVKSVKIDRDGIECEDQILTSEMLWELWPTDSSKSRRVKVTIEFIEEE